MQGYVGIELSNVLFGIQVQNIIKLQRQYNLLSISFIYSFRFVTETVLVLSLRHSTCAGLPLRSFAISSPTPPHTAHIAGNVLLEQYAASTPSAHSISLTCTYNIIQINSTCIVTLKTVLYILLVHMPYTWWKNGSCCHLQYQHTDSRRRNKYFSFYKHQVENK